MLCGAFCAFCACAAQNPNVRSASEAKKDGLFTGDFMSDVPVCLVQDQRRSVRPVAHVRFGSITDIGASPHHVRFTPESGHSPLHPIISSRPKSASRCEKLNHAAWLAMP